MSEESKPQGIVGCTAGLGASWMPIDSAPKDETHILVSNGEYVHESWWSGAQWCLPGTWKDWWCGVTHWMPMPEAPNDRTHGQTLANPTSRTEL